MVLCSAPTAAWVTTEGLPGQVGWGMWKGPLFLPCCGGQRLCAACTGTRGCQSHQIEAGSCCSSSAATSEGLVGGAGQPCPSDISQNRRDSLVPELNS